MITKENLENWLEEMDHFEFSILLEVHENPLTIVIGYSSENHLDIYNRIILYPKDVEIWNFKKTKRFFPSEKTEIRMVESLITESSNIKLEFLHTFSEVLLECKSIELEQLPPIKIKPKIKFNETQVNFSAPPQKLLKPDFWISKLKERKINASFRAFGGEAKEINQIPEDYTGYFIIENDRIPKTHKGIFISACKVTKESMYFILQCQDEKSYELWIELIDIFSEVEKSRISIGEITFNRKVWKNKIKKEFEKGRSENQDGS